MADSLNSAELNITSVGNGYCDNNSNLPVLDIELLQKSSSGLNAESLRYLVHQFLEVQNVRPSDVNCLNEFKDEQLRKHLQELRICDDRTQESKEHLETFVLRNFHHQYHVYKLSSEGPGNEELEEDIPAASHWVLPSADFHGLWESLVYDSAIKNQLINFVMTTILFSDCRVDSNLISWNRVVLLHGPPGTGKTSLCKALAQKLCIRLGQRYKYGQLIEINSHSLFSRWFSESGKLVMKMFQKIQELISDPEALVFVLIDEVESLAHTRSASVGGTEPSDAIRVVNALLTQIDQIRRYPNVIILTTSNMTEAIDLAFVDRADIKYFVGMPSDKAIYQILRLCLLELQQKGIIIPPETVLPWEEIPTCHWNNHIWTKSTQLKEIARSCQGLSGRTLKKLPFLAHALFVQTPQTTLENFLVALKKAAIQQFKEREDLKMNSSSKNNPDTINNAM